MSQPPRGDVPSSADPHAERERHRYDKPIASREHIRSLLKDTRVPLTFEALAELLGYLDEPEPLEGLRRRLGAMERDGQLIRNRKGGLVPVDDTDLIAGRVSAHPDGFGFLIADDGDTDVYLNGKQMRQVLHGDRVVACITGLDRRGRREGRIVDVVERANHSLVGRLVIEGGVASIVSDNKRIHQDLMIPTGELQGAANGEIVVAEIAEQPSRRRGPIGRVVEVLGEHLRPGMEIDVSLHSHDIPFRWPEAVSEQATGFSTTVPAGQAKGRKDVRDLPLVTIDGADARDFDDAVYCERSTSGWKLFVAIADVAHYVQPGSPLDDEALARGTSVYFPGRVVPMLPEVLSNGLCSINPDVDRLCMLCEMTLDATGHLKKAKFHNGIMRSHARLTYSQVNEILSEPGSDLRDSRAAVVPHLQALHDLYKVLQARRHERGAIEFESTETRILFDANKKIADIVPVERNDAHKLIEECMILANIATAMFLADQEVPALYRVHQGPKADRLDDLRAFLALHSLALGGGDSPGAEHYTAVMQQIAGRPDRSIIQTMLLRSMRQAVYQPKNEGHFGLALSHYSHFTSPIRRYPDLLVHRAIKYTLARGKRADYGYTFENMQALGEHCSMTERRADEATRDVVSWLKCEYMLEHVGDEFNGVISAVTSFGLFVDLTGIHVEGLIHVTNLAHDYYRFDTASQSLVGERTGRRYRLGDELRVRVENVNLDERKIDFMELESGVAKRKKGRQSDKRASMAVSSDRPAVQPLAAADNSDGKRKTGPNPGSRPEQGQDSMGDTQHSSPSETPRVDTTDAVAEEARREKRRRKRNKSRERNRERKSESATSAQPSESATPRGSWASASVGTAERPQARAANDDSVARIPAAAGKVTASKVAAKKVAAKKAPVSKVRATQAIAKKAVAKKASVSKVRAKKALAKKKKVAAKKAPAGTAAAGKVATEKASAAGLVARKSAAKKAPTSKAVAGKAASGKAVARQSGKAAAKKPVARKRSSAKPAANKTALKKAPAGKTTAKKATARKPVTGKAASDKPARTRADKQAKPLAASKPRVARRKPAGDT